MATESEKRDAQRQSDRDAELAKQAEVRDALDAHYKAEREEAEKRLEDPTRLRAAEEARLEEFRKPLNEAVKRHDKNAAKAAKENA